jgi:hydroxyacylglutathione hydrolase
MNLEDHLGDIVRKARNAAGVSAAAAAKAAGLSGAELDTLEASGQCAGKPDLRALAGLIGLHPAKLEGIAAGWLPQEHRLSRWRELRQIGTSQGGNAVNCFLAWDPDSRQAAVFDTGWEASPVVRVIEENQLALTRLFITHSHQDHVAALRPLRKRFPDLVVHGGPGFRGAGSLEMAASPVTVGRLRIGWRNVPGHAEDGVVYLVENWLDQAPTVLVAGDTLFAGSMARGFVSPSLLRQSVREQILSLAPDTLICPGHGPVSTVQEELEHNPFF